MVVGLRSDKTVVAQLRVNSSHYAYRNALASKEAVASWENVVAISSSHDSIVGLTLDGKILSTDSKIAARTADWTNIKQP